MILFVRHLKNILGFCLIEFIVFLTCVNSSWADLSTVQNKPKKIVAVYHGDYSPVSFFDKNTSRPAGFFVDIIEAIALREGFQMDYVRRNTWPEMIDAIERGDADIGVLLKSKEREMKLLFSAPIEITYLSFFARSKSSVDDKTVPAGYTVGVIKGSMSHEQLKTRSGLELLTVGSYEEGIFSLLAGEIGLFAGEESSILKRARETHLDDRIKKVGKPFVERERGIALRRDNLHLLELLNKSLSGFVGSPEYQDIYIKWYGPPTSYWTVRRILAVSGVFLLIVVGGMALWRYLSITRINKKLISQITERKKAEEILQKTNQTLSALIQYSPLAIICTDLDTNVLIWNPAAEWIFGWRQDEVLGRKNPIVPKDKQEEYLKLRENVRQGDPYHATELHRQKKDGTLIHLNAASAALYDNTNNVIGLLGIFEDITERKNAEEKLKKSEQQLHESQQVAQLGNWDLDLITQKLEWSDQTFKLFDKSSDTFIPSPDKFARMVHPDDRGTVEKITSQALASDASPYHVVVRVINDSGRQWVMEAFGKVRRDISDKPLGIFGTVQDITNRKQAEENLKQSEQFIRNILDNVDEGFIVVDREFQILTANKAYCDQVGRVCDEIIGRNCYEISHKTSRPCYEEGEDCAVRHVFTTGEPHAALHKHTDAKGGIIYVETKAFPITDSSGAVMSVIETVNNITEKHLLEEERLKTQKLEAIGILAGGIAHDFNNLLQGVFGYISMAKITHDQKERSLSMLQQAEQALHLSVDLTTQLLTFSKGGKPLKKIMNLQLVIENSVKFALSGSSVDYLIKIEDELWSVEADEGQIAQVIQNIVLNADQAMPMGGDITVTLKNVVAPSEGFPLSLTPGKYVEITVADTGIGISEQYLSKIFDPYFTTKDKGSGLGLATSYSIIRNHGGLIDVKSKLGSGTTFVVYMPAIEGEAAKITTIPATTTIARTGRILVMDDEEVVRNIVGIMLTALGHEVEFAEKGEEAFAKYREALSSGRRFDFVILDLTIRGGKGGKETVQELIALDPEVTAVVSSGYSDDIVLSDYQSYGFSACLMKPYEIDILKDTINALLK